MRISDWSSDVCSSDLEREWDKRRVAGPGGDRDRGKRRLRRADHGGHALTIPVRQMTGRSKSPPPPPGRTGERLMANDREARAEESRFGKAGGSTSRERRSP